jgi:3-oxoacyl-[acyl-carrier protein] reductase
MNLQLDGKRALITGSSSGIGAGTARVLAREGAMVVVHGRDEKRARQVADEIANAGGRARVAIGDLADDAQARAVAETAEAAFGGIDIVINNAGGAGGKQQADFLGTPPETWITTYQINVISALRMVQHFIPPMKQRGWGRIIQISSTSATQPLPYSLPDYHAAKAAVVNFSVGLSKYLGGTGITVNTVMPGTVLTPALERTFRQWAHQRNWGEDWDEVERRVVAEMFPNPSGRVGRIEDVANMVAFIASPLAGFVNGANLRVDGGRVPTIN